MEKTYYQLTVDQKARRATVNIYGTITSAAPRIRSWYNGEDTGERSALDIKQAIDAMDVDDIDVFINSYGGEVAEACAIYAALRRHKATADDPQLHVLRRPRQFGGAPQSSRGQ